MHKIHLTFSGNIDMNTSVVWHIYFGYFRHLAAHLCIHMLQKFRIFVGHLPKHQGSFFFGYSGHSQDMDYNLQIYFGHFGHSADDLFLYMLRKFCIFSGHLSKHQDCFPSGILDTPRKCITFGIIISDISDIQQLIYLCICSGSSAFFQVICLGTRAVFFRIFWTLPGHGLQFANLFRTFRTCSSWFISAHAPEVPHFFRTFAQAPGLFSFRYSGHSQEVYYIWHNYFGYFRHSAAHLFVHMLWKFCIFSGHLPGHQGCFSSDILDTPRTCITVCKFILDISDIQQLIYFCTCSGSSALFQNICLSTRTVFFRVFMTLPRSVLHLA